jgi:hypothetical protein
MKPILFLTMMVALAGRWQGMAEGRPVEPVKNSYGAEAWVLPPETAKLKETEGIKGIQSNCLLCHSVDYISTQPKLTRAQWTAGVEKMRAKFGAVISTNAVPQIVEYLTVNYGRETPKP